MKKQTFLKTNPKNKNFLRFKGLTKKQVQLLKENKLPPIFILGLLGGMVSEDVYDVVDTEEIIKPNENNENSKQEDNEDTTEEETFDFEVPTTIEFSDAVNDNMSFAEAFSAARKDVDASGFFNWRGNSYHTLTKEEWDALSEEEKQQFYDKIQEHSDFGKAEEYHEKEDDIIEDDEVIDDDDNDSNETPDEISHDDIIYDDNHYNRDTNEDSADFVNVDEIGETEDILDGLNDGTATEEAEGIVLEYNTNQQASYEEDVDDIEYDNDSLDDLV